MAGEHLAIRALAKGVLAYVSGPGHTMDCAAMLWEPSPDGGRTLKGTEEGRCDCRHREANADRAELRAFAMDVLGNEYGLKITAEK